MKKIMIFIVVALIAITGVIGTLILLKDEEVLNKKSYEIEGVKIKDINIDVRDSEIEVAMSKDEKIYINYLESDKEFYNISILKDKTLSMTSSNNKNWKDYIGSRGANKRKIKLLLPEKVLMDLKLATTNEDIKLVKLNTLNNVSLKTNNGNINFNKLDIEKFIILTAKNGNIKGSIIGGYDDFNITCKVKKGECNLPTEKKNGHKKLTVDINNGDAQIDISK